MTALDSIAPQPESRPGAIPIARHYLDFRADPLNFWLDTGRLGPVQIIELGPSRTYWVITDADLFQEILQKKAKTFPRDKSIRNRDGINKAPTVFNAPTYDEWLWRRRLLQPGFHMKQIRSFADTMVDEGVSLANELNDGQTADFVSLMKKLTMRIICKTMFSASLEETEVLQAAFEQTSFYSFKRLSTLIKLPEWVPTPLVQKTKEAFKTKQDTIREFVVERLESGDPQGDMLDMLIGAHLEEDGRKFSELDLVSEMNSLIFAGHETTAMTLVWLFYTLSQDPELAAKVQAEVDQLNGERPTLESIESMPFSNQVIQETLRMYPPVYVTLRESEIDQQLGTYPIPAGTELILNIRGLHRDPRYWDDPDRFWPERFAPENSEGRHKFAFMPFIGGPKKCIGDSFAMMEMRLLLPTLLQRLRFEYASARPAREKAGFVMETEAPVEMKIHRLRS